MITIRPLQTTMIFTVFSSSNKNMIFNQKNTIKKCRETKDQKDLNKVYKSADSLSRKGIIHKNKANRIKSRNAKALNKAK